MQELILESTKYEFPEKQKLKQAAKNIEHDCAYSHMQYFSNVPHFDIIQRTHNYYDEYIEPYNKTNEEIFEEFEKFSNPLARAFVFSVFDEINEKKIRKIKS